MTDAELIERLREYACHKFTCIKMTEGMAKCDCGLAELLDETNASPEELLGRYKE